MTMKEFIKKLLEDNKKYFTQHKGYVLPEIPEKKLKTIRKIQDLSDAEEILWAVDTTLGGSAEDNTVWTNFGIAFRQKILGQLTIKKILWAEIEQFYYDKKKGFVFLNKKGEEIIFERMEFDVYYKKDTEQINAISKVIEQIIDFVKFNTNEMPLSDVEKKFMDDVKFMLEDDGQIIETEQRILDKMRQKYGISQQRATEIIQKLLENHASSEEVEYMTEVENILKESGKIGETERRTLEFFREKLGISKEKAAKLETIVFEKLGK